MASTNRLQRPQILHVGQRHWAAINVLLDEIVVADSLSNRFIHRDVRRHCRAIAPGKNLRKVSSAAIRGGRLWPFCNSKCRKIMPG